MPRLNDAFRNLNAAYLFAEIRRRTRAFTDAHPEARLINLGIGDVTQPLPPAVVRALHEAVDELARAESFKGYGPYTGYDWLAAEIARHDFAPRGITLGTDEIFISDGGKSDSANLQELFARDCVVALMDPVYPVYLDSNVMAGCFPNNPTGAVATRAALQRWVIYARAHDALILFDAAYEAYIVDADVPHSIYEIEGAREVAIESRSFSKNAGFTGLRLAYTVVPKETRGRFADGTEASLNALWHRRTAIKYQGPPYLIQKAGAAVFTPEGQKQVRALIEYYLENARLIAEGLRAAGVAVFGGRNAPYIWLRAPAGVTSWDFFDALLTRAHVVGVPGSGFGPSGEGYFRLTAFGSREQTLEAVERIRAV